jgi:NAD(P)-dependent dehydrogenase (short-subunit alcohol dehydrogenase family)
VRASHEVTNAHSPRFGRLDIVVNAEAIMALSPIARGEVEAFDRVVATNLRVRAPTSAQHIRGCDPRENVRQQRRMV